MALSVHTQIDANKNRTWMIMFFFVLFITAVGFVLGKSSGYGASWAAIALIFSGISSVSSYYFGDKIVLALSGAREADRSKEFDLYTVTENMAIAAGLPKP